MQKEDFIHHARELGFSYCGIAPAEPLRDHRTYYESYIQQKKHESLSYLEKNLEKRLNPFTILPDAKSVITVLLNYYPAELIPEEDNFIISKYAYGKDYHSIMKKTRQLAEFIVQKSKEKDPSFTAKAPTFVDSGSVLEKIWAQKCGVGWQGKNSLLIHKNGGSFFFIGIILTNIELDYDIPKTDHCGTCTKCMEACPTGALENPYQLTISKCISYHTIETKEDPPPAFKGKFKSRIYGCDICQDVCPYNRFATPSKEVEFNASERLLKMRKEDWLNLTEEQFGVLFENTSIARTGYEKLMKNIRFVAED